MYWVVVSVFVAITIWGVMKIPRMIREELEDRSPEESNQSGNALIAILVISGLCGIFLVIFIIATYLQYK